MGNSCDSDNAVACWLRPPAHTPGPGLPQSGFPSHLPPSSLRDLHLSLRQALALPGESWPPGLQRPPSEALAAHISHMRPASSIAFIQKWQPHLSIPPFNKDHVARRNRRQGKTFVAGPWTGSGPGGWEGGAPTARLRPITCPLRYCQEGYCFVQQMTMNFHGCLLMRRTTNTDRVLRRHQTHCHHHPL